jgi:hypothetical protein
MRTTGTERSTLNARIAVRTACCSVGGIVVRDAGRDVHEPGPRQKGVGA